MKRKWQRVLSWILTLTMLLGTFEGTGIGTINAQAADPSEPTAVIASADGSGSDDNQLVVSAGFEKLWNNAGVIVWDEQGLVSVTEFTAAPTLVEGIYVYEQTFTGLTDKIVTPNKKLDLRGYYSVQAFAYDGDSYATIATPEEFYELALANVKSTAVTFRGKDTVLNKNDLYVVNTGNENNELTRNRVEAKQITEDGILSTTATRFEYGDISSIVGSNDNISPVTFAAKQAGSEGAVIYKDVDWELVGGQIKKVADTYQFQPIDGLSATAYTDGEGKLVAGNLCGMDIVKNADGSVTLSGKPNKAITNPDASLKIENLDGAANANVLDVEKPVVFKLYAKKIGAQGGAETAAQKVGEYNMYIAFWPMVSEFGVAATSSPLQLQVDRSNEGVDIYKDAKHTAFYAAPAYNYSYKTTYTYLYNKAQIVSADWIGQFSGKEGYEVKDDVKDKTNNTILAQTFVLKNTNPHLDLTNVDIQIVNDGDYIYDLRPDSETYGNWVLVEDYYAEGQDGYKVTMTKDADCFTAPDAADITTIKANGGTAEFTVKPVEGKEAVADKNGKRIPYEAWLVIKADQLPASGLRLAKLNLTISPDYDFYLTEGDEGERKVDVELDKFNGYDYVDLGTYSAANDIPNLALRVSDSDTNSTARFIPINNQEATRLPGWVNGEANTLTLGGLDNMDPVITIKGALKPETYLGDDAGTYAECNNAATGPIYYESEANGWTVYLIPLKVKDSQNNDYEFYGKLTVKPANLEVKEIVSDTVQNPVSGKSIADGGETLDWYGAAGAHEELFYSKEITIKNTNKYPISLVLGLNATDLVSDYPDLWDDEETKHYITIPSGQSIRVKVGNDDYVTEGDKAGVLTIKGLNTNEGENSHIIDTFYVNYKYKAISATHLTIIAPEDENKELADPAHPWNGSELGLAREINIGFGETKTWNVKSIGASGNAAVKYKLAQVGDIIDPDGDAAPITVTDNLGTAEDPELVDFEYETDSDVTGIGSWGFSFTNEGRLVTYGPIKTGTFYICVSANTVSSNGSQSAYSYYKINVISSNKAMTISGIDDTVTNGRAKELYASAKDIENSGAPVTQDKLKAIADDYNFVINTTESLRETLDYEISVKNNTQGRMKNTVVTFETVYGAGYFTSTEPVKLGELAIEETAKFNIGFVAPGVEGVEGGKYYVQKVTVTADGVADMVFFVKVYVDKSPYVVPFMPNQDYHDSSMNWKPYSRKYTDELIPDFTAAYTNGIGGAKVAVGTEIPDGAMTLKAKRWDADKKSYVDIKDYYSYEWYPTTSADPSIDGEFTLTSNGKITGKPTHPGVYYMTIKLSDSIKGQGHTEYAYFDIVIVVPGSINLDVVTNANKVIEDNVLVSANITKGYTVFDGSVKGDVPSARKTFTITNKDTEKTLTGLKVTVSGADAAHFNANVVNSQTEIAPGETATFVVAPFNTTTAGDFEAIIKIEGTQIGYINIPIYWCVVEPLNIIPPTKDDTTVPVGQPFDLVLEKEGGHASQEIIWKAMEKDDNADDTLLKKFWNSMKELGIGELDPIKDHASVITSAAWDVDEKGKDIYLGGLLTTHDKILTGAGIYTFTASVNMPARFKLPSGGYAIPEQFANNEITITINPTPYVYIKADEDNLSIGKSENETVPKADLRYKGRKYYQIAEFLKKISFTYKTMADDYKNTALTRKFELQNDLRWMEGAPVELTISANIMAGDQLSTDFEIVSISGNKITGTKKAGQMFTISDNNVFVDVRPAAKLTNGTYTADLVIAGSGIETVRMPLSFTVEDATWKIGFTDGEAALSGNVIEKQPIKRNDAKVDNKPAYLTVFATGNQPVKINSVVELDDNGDPLAKGVLGKLVLTPNFEFAVAGVGGTTFNPVADPANPGAGENDHGGRITITVREADKLQDDTVQVRVYYTSGTNNTDQKYVDVDVKYVVYEEMNSKITYTPSNEGEDILMLTSAKKKAYEGYKAADYAQEFTIHNGEEGDLSKGIYYTVITSAKQNLFTINGKPADEVKLIKAGESGTVTIAPVAGLADGYYNTEITFQPDNGPKHVVAIGFRVLANEQFTTTVRRDEMRIASGFNPRLFDTLKELEPSDSDNFDVIKGVTEGGRAYFLIDLNPNIEDPDASRFDVYVTENETKDIVIRKARYSDYNYKLTSAMTAELNASNKPSTDVTQPTTTIYDKDANGEDKFTSIVFTVEETITYKKSRGGEEIVTWYVPYGNTIESAEGFDPKLIALKSTDNRALEGFVDEDTNQPVKTDERILDDHNLIPLWHDHVYATNLEDPTSKIVSGNQVGVEWVWEEDGNGGFKGAKVYLTCVSDKCTDADKGVVSLNASLTKDLVPASCTVGGYTLYTATALFQKNGISYMCENKGNIIGDGHGHQWSFDWDNVKWFTDDPDAVSANVVKTCDSVSHNTLVDGEKTFSISADKIEFIGTAPTCEEPGHGYYEATFNDPDIPEADIAAKKNVVSLNMPEMDPIGHKWTVSDCTMEGSFDEGAKSAVLYLVCENDASHTVSVNVTKDNITLVSENAVSKTFRAETVKDMQSLHAEYTFWNHTEHTYSVSWNWISATSENAVVRAIFTCTVGGEIETRDAVMTRSENVETFTWTATVTGPDGKEYVDTKTFDRVTGEEITHDHVWSKPVWDWTGTTSKNAAAKAIFTCSVNGAQPHVVEVWADITEVRTTTTVTYTAKVTGPDNNEYTDVKVIDLATGKEITHEDHVWSKPVWDWTGTTSENGVAKATFNCTKTGEEHSVVLNATVTEKSRKANKVVYVATVSGPDAKDYKDSCTVTWNEKGEIKVEPGKGGENEQDILEGAFTVIGVEEEYAYTGARIKPAIRVIDNERDVELGNGTDYSVSYTGKNKIGQTNTVKIKGKGNYAGANAEISFKIIDPKTLVEGEDLAASVKSIAKISDSFVYDGTFKYPATITVNMKDKSTIVFTHDGDGEYSHEGDKTVALSFCNNKNKGTAYVAATGSDGKTKKKNFSIKAADISSAKFEAEDATWAVKAENVKIEGTYGEDDLELVAGGDFKVTYKAKNAGDGAGEAKIAGKGNFKGKAVVKYNVKALDLSEENIIVTAKTGKAVKVTVVDNAGNALGKKLYSYTLTNNDTEGNAKTKLAAGTVTVTVKPGEKAGSNVTGEASAEATVATDISKTKIKVAKTFTKTYTGEEIKLDDEDFAADKINVNGLVVGTDFEVVGYKNNLKKGTMTVTIQGIGEKSGTKTFKVKIVGKSFGTAK